MALVGEPNVGKSTLVNALVGQKFSIVSDKPQTTRQRVLGIATDEGSQIIFLDTPGLLTPKYLLQERMVSYIDAAVSDADVVLLLADAGRQGRISEGLETLFKRKKKSRPFVYVLNKTDLLSEGVRSEILAAEASKGIFDAVIGVSALKGTNIDEVRKVVLTHLPEQPPFYPDDIISEHPERFFAAEFIREQIFLKFRDEIPYSTAVEIRDFKERSAGKTFISADVIVERDSQKRIVIGKNGQALKELGVASRAQIEEFLGMPVFLELFVKVRDKWRQKEIHLNRLGYGRSG